MQVERVVSPAILHERGAEAIMRKRQTARPRPATLLQKGHAAVRAATPEAAVVAPVAVSRSLRSRMEPSLPAMQGLGVVVVMLPAGTAVLLPAVRAVSLWVAQAARRAAA